MGGTLASAYELVILDLDGVVYVGPNAVPGAATAITSIVDMGTAVAFVTNNASRTPHDIARSLAAMGIPASPDRVVTSGQVAARVLAANLPPAASVLVVGSAALRAEIAAVGLTPVTAADQRPPAVVQGYGQEVGWAQLAEACLAIRAGARWVATNTDATVPSPLGPLPGNGSLVAALAVALGRQGPDTVVGKPEPALFRVAAERAEARRVLVVGDRLDTDIAAAAAAGMDSLLVLTGISTAADVLVAPDVGRPTHVAFDLAALSQPDSASRVPVPAVGRMVGAGGPGAGRTSAGGVCAEVAGWSANNDGGQLVLGGAGEPLPALLALAAAAWSGGRWSAIIATSAAARSVLRVLGLTESRGRDAPMSI